MMQLQKLVYQGYFTASRPGHLPRLGAMGDAGTCPGHQVSGSGSPCGTGSRTRTCRRGNPSPGGRCADPYYRISGGRGIGPKASGDTRQKELGRIPLPHGRAYLRYAPPLALALRHTQPTHGLEHSHRLGVVGISTTDDAKASKDYQSQDVADRLAESERQQAEAATSKSNDIAALTAELERTKKELASARSATPPAGARPVVPVPNTANPPATPATSPSPFNPCLLPMWKLPGRHSPYPTSGWICCG